MSMAQHLEMDSVVALADLCARAGATQLELGYLEDGVPVEQARWYAQVRFRGALLVCDERSGLDEAADALARRILRGALCAGCRRQVVLSMPVRFRDCRWYREGASWVRGCDGKRAASRD